MESLAGGGRSGCGDYCRTLNRKVIALLSAGNPASVIAQIRGVPSVRNLRSLEHALGAATLTGRWKNVDLAVADPIRYLPAPRLYRSP